MRSCKLTSLFFLPADRLLPKQAALIQQHEINDRKPGTHRQLATDVLKAESAAILNVIQQLDANFDSAVKHLVECRSNVIVSGVGKSGLIGQKLSATLASTGTPSHFLHPTEAMHGDLGRVHRGDVVIMLSYSGATEELLALAAILRQDSVPLISITCKAASHLGRLSTAALSVGNSREACPFNLAPTASTAAMLALGDALALAASLAKGFAAEDFHKRHPGGLLGRKLLPVRDILRFKVGKNLAVANPTSRLGDVLEEADKYTRRCGAILVQDEKGQLIGIFTDGDLRRLLTRNGAQILDQSIQQVMSANPVRVLESDPVSDVVQIVRERRLDEIPVVDQNGAPVGVVDVQDLIAMKLIEEDD